MLVITGTVKVDIAPEFAAELKALTEKSPMVHARPMQAKDLSDRTALAVVARQEPACWWIMAEALGVPRKLVLAKMRKLVKRGLASGCPCGCRGDFRVTEKGKEMLT